MKIQLQDLEYILRLTIKVTEYKGPYKQELYLKDEVEKLFGIQFDDDVEHYTQEFSEPFVTISELYDHLQNNINALKSSGERAEVLLEEFYTEFRNLILESDMKSLRLGKYSGGYGMC